MTGMKSKTHADSDNSTELPDPRVLAEQANSLVKAIPETSAVMIVTACFTTALLWDVSSPIRNRILVAWLVLVLVVQGLRVGLAHCYNRSKAGLHAQYWVDRVSLNSFFSGLTWGTGGALLFATTKNPLEQTFAAVLLLGLGAGAITATIWQLKAYRSFVFTSILPLAFAGFYLAITRGSQDRITYLVMTVLFALYLLFMFRLSNRLYGDLDQALVKKYKFETLNQKLEENRLAMEKIQAQLAEANETRAMILAFAGHDLRNKLMSFQIALEQHHVEHTVPEAYVDLTDQVEDMEEFLTHVTQFSDIRSNKLEPVLTQFDLDELLRTECATLGARAARTSLSLIYHPGAMVVTSDPSMLKMIIYNLILNAVKYTPAHGRVSVRSYPIANPVRPTHVIVEIADNGPGGLPADLMQELESRVETTAFSAMAPGQRRGIGLRIVAAYVRRLDHPLKVQSIAGVGTTFTITLPCSASPPRTIHATSKSPAESVERISVVLVDDDEVWRTRIAQQLADSGFYVASAASASDAITQIRTGGPFPQVIVCDYHLGDHTTGLGAAQLIISEQNTPLPILIITSDASEGVKQTVLATGASLLLKASTNFRIEQAIRSLVADARAG